MELGVFLGVLRTQNQLIMVAFNTYTGMMRKTRPVQKKSQCCHEECASGSNEKLVESTGTAIDSIQENLLLVSFLPFSMASSEMNRYEKH